MPKLYEDLAAWWPLFSPPVHYIEEADDILPTLLQATDAPPRTLLELGSGGGSLAFHLKHHFKLTLSDLSEGMLAVSKAYNPESEHVQGDMRTLALGRQFDLVLVHDAVMYMLEKHDLRAAIATAARHCRSGGAVVFMPDCVRETFAPREECGGEDGEDGRALRYLEWAWDQDPHDSVYDSLFSIVMRERDGTVHSVLDHHKFGVFPRATWINLFREEGLDVTTRTDPWKRDIFVGRKR
jgi:hypothetical protein